jgi:hypothetical protein
MVERNLEDIAREAAQRGMPAVRIATPHVVVLAPTEYWARYNENRATAGWLAAIEVLAGRLRSALGLEVSLLELVGGTLEMGSAGRKPSLRGACELRDLAPPVSAPIRAASAPGGESYLGELCSGFWDHVERAFGDAAEILDRPARTPNRPPVFVRSAADQNVITPPGASEAQRREILAAVPASERHRHFGSMKSSQALTQSVFGSLHALGRLGALAGLEDEDGLPAFFDRADGLRMHLEHAVRTLNEPRPTSVDVWLEGPVRVAVECKLTESAIGACSRPGLRPNDSRYETDLCDGSYTHQRGRHTRCTLSEQGIRYWQYIPELLDWDADADLAPCPFAPTYQLVRNVLAACVREDGRLDAAGAHAIMVYDGRNPAFGEHGQAMRAWSQVKGALRDPALLRRCSWQRLLSHLDVDPGLQPLTRAIREKYVSLR